MGLAKSSDHISHSDYLEGEKLTSIRHEYVRGEVFAMGGAIATHGRLVANIGGMLYGALRKGPCRYFLSDLKVFVETADAYYYPDVVVTCAPEDERASYVLKRPKVIFEVLSPSTSAFDRGQKFVDYRSLGSLEEYVLVSQDAMRVERYRRQGANQWHLEIIEGLQTLQLTSLDLELPLEDIYEGVAFDGPELDASSLA